MLRNCDAAGFLGPVVCGSSMISRAKPFIVAGALEFAYSVPGKFRGHLPDPANDLVAATRALPLVMLAGGLLSASCSTSSSPCVSIAEFCLIKSDGQDAGLCHSDIRNLHVSPLLHLSYRSSIYDESSTYFAAA